MALKRKTTGWRLVLEVDEPRYWWNSNPSPERIERDWSDKAKEIEDFLRDHRSIDEIRVHHQQDSIMVCEFCGAEISDGDESWGCCDRSIEEANSYFVAIEL